MRIYLAGPEVFLKNATAVLHTKKTLCSRYGHEGVTPFDADLGTIENDFESGLRIAKSNEALIDACDAVIANISPFRGLHADVGTVYELGYARAKGKVLYAYTHQADTHATRTMEYYNHNVRPDTYGLPREIFGGTLIDDFGMVENAMVDGGVHLSGGRILIHRVSFLKPTDLLQEVTGLELCLKTMNGVKIQTSAVY